jgi:RNA polymerase sigma-70 factor (family 1)
MPIEGQHILWDAVRQGEDAAFRELFDLYWEDLFTLAARITRDHALAQDSVQSLFINLWEKHTALPEVTAIAPYLRGALKNRLLNAIRDENLYQRHVDLFKQVWEEGDHSTVEQLTFKETQQQILHTINQLPDKMKDVFYLHRVEQLSVAEIADKLGTSPQTVRNQLNTASQKLKHLWVAETLLFLMLMK